MEKIFAVIKHRVVSNIIVADSQEIAEAVSPDCTVIEITDYVIKPSIGVIYSGSEFIFPSVEEETAGETIPEGV